MKRLIPIIILASSVALAELPSGYVEYTYLQGNGVDARVVTDYMPTPNYDTIKAVVEWPSGVFDHNQAIWCAREIGAVTTCTLFALKDGNNGYKYRFDYASSQVANLSPALATDVKYTITAEGRIFNSVGENGQTQSHNRFGKATDFTTGGPLVLFASYTLATDNNLGNWGRQRLYSFTVTRGGAVIHDFVPAVRTSDNRSGVYDKVGEGRFYPGEGTFIMGDLTSGVLAVSTSTDGIGSPSPAYGTQVGLSAGETRAVSCGATAVANAAGTATYTCIGWKLYDDNGTEVDHGTETSFTYTHPTPAAYRRLEWQWETDTYHRYVVPAGTAGNTPAEPYDSWATAANSIASAYAAPMLSGNPYVIHVAPGLYDQTAVLAVSRGNVEFRSDDGDGNLARETTILDGGFRSVADNVRTNGIFSISANAHGVTIRGLTLQNACSPTSGGGVRVASGARALTIDSCTLSNCQARLRSGNSNSYGGGVFFEGEVSGLGHLITNTLFHSCSSANYGGSIRLAKSRSAYGSRSEYLLIQDCAFVKSSVNKTGDPTSGYGYQMGGTISGPVWVERTRFDGASCSGSTCRGSFLHEGKYAVFDGCIFENSENVSLFAGGACTISNSVIRGNKGVFNFGDYGITLVGCIFTNQPAIGTYSGMGTAYVSLTMRNCLYAHNTQPLVVQGSSILDNCTIVSNYNNGIALTSGRTTTLRIRNCVVFGNRYQSYANNVNGPTSTGDFFYTQSSANRSDVSIVITNSYFEKGATVSLSNYQGAGAAVSLFSFDGSGSTATISQEANAAKDKLFVDWPNHNWRLQRKSPLREVGVRYSWMNAPAIDLDGNPRLTDKYGKAFASSALPDLGCYECQDVTPRATTIMAR